MLTSERKAHLLETLRRDRRLVAKDQSRYLGTSEDTIRRDLRELARDGLLLRVHGGALPASPALADFGGRLGVAVRGKAAIGRAAGGLIEPGQVVFLDGGTTAVQMARHLPRNLTATIVTHSPSVAVELASHPHIDVELIGGRLFKHSVVSVGARAAEAIAAVRADVCFIGATGVHPIFGVTTGDAEEAAVKRLLSAQAAETVLMASHEKIGAVSAYLVSHISRIETIVAEETTSPDQLEAFRKLGIRVITARVPGEETTR